MGRHTRMSLQHRRDGRTYFLFVQDLHGVELVCLFVFDEHDSSERAGAQSLEPLEVVQARCALCYQQRGGKEQQQRLKCQNI